MKSWMLAALILSPLLAVAEPMDVLEIENPAKKAPWPIACTQKARAVSDRLRVTRDRQVEELSSKLYSRMSIADRERLARVQGEVKAYRDLAREIAERQNQTTDPEMKKILMGESSRVMARFQRKAFHAERLQHDYFQREREHIGAVVEEARRSGVKMILDTHIIGFRFIEHEGGENRFESMLVVDLALNQPRFTFGVSGGNQPQGLSPEIAFGHHIEECRESERFEIEIAKLSQFTSDYLATLGPLVNAPPAVTPGNPGSTRSSR